MRCWDKADGERARLRRMVSTTLTRLGRTRLTLSFVELPTLNSLARSSGGSSLNSLGQIFSRLT
eukprot:452288-Pyramimonas_sp.AAC.1